MPQQPDPSDLGERRAVEEELRRLAAIVESSDDAIISETLDGILTSWNPAAERLYGYRAEEVLGKPRSIILPPERQAEFAAMLERLRRGERIEHFETVRIRKDGTRIDTSVSMFPIRDASGRLIGSAGIGRDITERKRAEEERELLLEREQAARLAAERSSERMSRLQAATAALSEALTPTQVGKVIAEQGMAMLGAKSALIVQLTEDGQNLEIVSALGYAPERLAAWQRFPLETAVPLAEVVRSGHPVWPESTADRIAHYPHLAEAYSNNPPGGWLSVPLVAHGRPIGGLSLSFVSTPILEQADREFILALARQCAQALDRAQLFAAEHRARGRAERSQRRLAFLAEAAAVLTSSLGYETTLQSVARLAVPELADWCVVDILSEEQGNHDRTTGNWPGRNQALRRLAVTHIDPSKVELAYEVERRYPTPPDAPYGLPQVLRTGKPELVPEITDGLLLTVAQDPEHLEILRKLGLRSYICVPLEARGRRLGALSFIMAESGRRFTQDDLPLAQELAQRAALAIDNARLYREAQEAIRTREEFLSIASHELRTPLTTLTAHTQLLQRVLEKDGVLDPSRALRSIQSIGLQAERLGRLITQLLDVSRLEAGRLSLQTEVINLRALVHHAVASAQATTSKHSIEIVDAVEVWLRADSLRLEQVLANLLDNAIKYSPAGGPIELTLGVGCQVSGVGESVPNTQHPAPDTCAEIAVRDHGIGIPEDKRERIFERFYQAHGNRHTSGMGLGLYISRQIVELHGGELWAEFPDDGGTRFVVRLPNAQATSTEG